MRQKALPQCTRNLSCRLMAAGLLWLVALPLFAQPHDFSRFVAIGDSFMAGFSAGGLVEPIQQKSVPRLIALEAGVPSEAFEQPLASEPGIPPLLQLISTDPLDIQPLPGSGTPLNGDLPRAFNNLAVPGFRVADALTTTTGHAMADLVLRNQGPVIDQALSLDPTTTLVWIGMNDALAGITSGIVIDGVTLTESADFENAYRQLVEQLVAANSKVILVPIPRNWFDIPFVDYLPNVVTDPATGEPIMVDGDPVPLLGPNGPLDPGDAVLLSAQSALQAGDGIPVEHDGTGQPLSNEMVLSQSEQATILNRIDAFNESIQSIAQDQPEGSVQLVAGVDPVLEAITQGGFGQITDEFPSGGFYSLDGIHPTARGYEILAASLGGQILPAAQSVPAFSRMGWIVTVLGLLALGLTAIRN